MILNPLNYKRYVDYKTGEGVIGELIAKLYFNGMNEFFEFVPNILTGEIQPKLGDLRQALISFDVEIVLQKLQKLICA